MPRAAARMDLEVIIVKEGRQKDSYDITYMWKLKYDTNELIYETETDAQTEHRTVLAKGRGDAERQTGSLGLANAGYHM